MSIIKTIQKFHFIGAGGVSISALAKLMLKFGKTVSGSDRQFSDTITELNELGANVWVGVRPQEIARDALVVYSSAVKEDNEELKFCRAEGITAVERFVFLSEVEKCFQHEIAIAGTHGKTTVTSMVASIFLSANMCFTAHIGGTPVGQDNLIFKGTEWLITEACEYKRSMNALCPEYAVVLNAECDHPDTYRDLSDVYSAFDSFLNKPSVRHAFLLGGSAYQARYICANAQVHTFAPEHSDYCACECKELQNGCFGFRLVQYGIPKEVISLRVAGAHNIANALAAAAVSLEAGVPLPAVKKGLELFCGVKRRFEAVGTINGATIIIDYAHHPSEIKASIAVAKKVTKKRLITVFQPHTYSRTAQLFEEFKTSFLGSDVLYFTKSFSAREQEGAGKTAYDLYLAVKEAVMFCMYHENFLPLATAICREAQAGDVVLLLGAGDINLLADLIKDEAPTLL